MGGEATETENKDFFCFVLQYSQSQKSKHGLRHRVKVKVKETHFFLKNEEALSIFL